jgi:hypothetical protein
VKRDEKDRTTARLSTDRIERLIEESQLVFEQVATPERPTVPAIPAARVIAALRAQRSGDDQIRAGDDMLAERGLSTVLHFDGKWWTWLPLEN